jgi:hypothetical protein
VSKTNRETLFTIAYIVVGLIAVIAVGYLTFRHRFFRLPPSGLLPIPMRDCLIVGLFGSLIYASVQMRGAGLAILMIVLLFLTEVAIRPPIRPNSLMAAALYALPVGFALMMAAYAQKSLARFKLGRFLIMGLIVGAGYALMILLFLIKSHVEIRLGTIGNQAFMGAKLGAAMGLGFELIDLIGPRPKHEPSYDRPPA